MTDTKTSDPEFEKLQEFVKKRIEIQDHEEAIARLKGECAEIEDDAMKWFESNGIQNINMMGRTAYINRQTYAAKTDTFDLERAMLRLEECGFEDCARKNIVWQSLSARFREIGDEVPEELSQDFRVSEKFNIKLRKA